MPTKMTGLRVRQAGALHIEIHTDAGLVGTGHTFNQERNPYLAAETVLGLAHHVVGQTLEDLTAQPDALWRRLVGQALPGQPADDERAAIRMAAGALIDALWDLRAQLPSRQASPYLRELPRIWDGPPFRPTVRPNGNYPTRPASIRRIRCTNKKVRMLTEPSNTVFRFPGGQV